MMMYLHHFSDWFSISEIIVLFTLSKELMKANKAIIHTMCPCEAFGIIIQACPIISRS